MVVVDRLSKSAHFLILSYPFNLLQKLWQRNLWKASLSFTACPNQLLVIGTQSSSVISRKNFSSIRAPNYSSVPHTTYRRKLSIAASSNIFGVLFISGHENGVAIFLGRNIGIIRHTIFWQGWPLFRRCIEDCRPPLRRTTKDFHRYMKLISNS